MTKLNPMRSDPKFRRRWSERLPRSLALCASGIRVCSSVTMGSWQLHRSVAAVSVCDSSSGDQARKSASSQFNCPFSYRRPETELRSPPTGRLLAAFDGSSALLRSALLAEDCGAIGLGTTGMRPEGWASPSSLPWKASEARTTTAKADIREISTLITRLWYVETVTIRRRQRKVSSGAHLTTRLITIAFYHLHDA